MAGYATGEAFFASQALGFRHSHLDAAGYSYDQKHKGKDVASAADFLVKDEQGRAFLTSMVACLFARSVYTDELLAECLRSVGYGALADNMQTVSHHIQNLRWKTRFDTGFNPGSIRIPKRFTEVVTSAGAVDGIYLDALRNEYARRIGELATDKE
jgi:aldehyde:ferredoxin oxidoreductase